MEKGFGRGSWYTDILSLVEELPDEVWVSHTKHVGENWVVGQLKKIRAVILTFLKKMCLSYLNIYSPGYSLTWSEYENPDLCCNTRRACKIRLFHYLWKNFEVRSQKKSSHPPPPPPPPPPHPAFLFFWANTWHFAASHYIRETWEVAKITNNNSSFSYFFPSPQIKCTVFIQINSFLFFYVNYLALLIHSTNRPHRPKFLDSLW